MEIGQALNRKAQLERDIRDLIIEFEEDTRLKVEFIHFDYVEDLHEGRQITDVEVEARL